MRISHNHGGENRRSAKAAHRLPNRVADRLSAIASQNAETQIQAPTPAKNLLESSFEHLSASQKEMLARQLGHASFDALVKASKVVTLSDGSIWWMTADRNGALTAWNLCALQGAPSAQTGDTAGSTG
jgi:hypothetical protein